MIMHPSLSMTLVILILMFMFFLFPAITALILFIIHSRAAHRLDLLRPLFIQQLRTSTGLTAATIKVSDLTGDLMDMDVPMYRIEQVRRGVVQAGRHESLLLLSLLVCTAYEDIKSFKDALVELMENDVTGVQGAGDKLADMCKYPLTSYTLFKIALCLKSELPDDMTRALNDHSVSKDVSAVFRFRTVRSSFRYLDLPAFAVLISGAVHLYGMALPSMVTWSLLLLVVLLGGLTLLLLIRRGRALAHPISCKDIEADITLDIPDFKLR
ncbi:MAG: hypothetical protein M8349_08605 [ANME-2 cluster archaeon]|nr:hypothetical protein [ANME-2 cluster archaeon]